MIKGRRLDGLGGEEAAQNALEAIADLFGNDYLSSASESKALSLLWARQDRLSTVELFIFGCCLINCRKNNEKWLKQVIREIKKCPAKSRGLFTEILYFGMFETEKSSIDPAPGNNPGYDFSIEYPSGTRNYVSVKNIDLSDELRSFNQACRKLRSRWIERLKQTKSNFQLLVLSTSTLIPQDFDQILQLIKRLPVSRSLTQLREGLVVACDHLPVLLPLANSKTSDMVVVCGPPPESERIRYSKRLKQAANNIVKHTGSSPNSIRTIFMRMHTHADYQILESVAKDLTEDPQENIDCVIFYQPSYVRNQNNESFMNHFLKVVTSTKFDTIIKNEGITKMNLMLGTASSEQSFEQLKFAINGRSVDFSPSDYMFQKGDIFIQGRLNEQSLLTSIAPGVRQHVIIDIGDQSMEFQSKIASESDELLIL